MRGYLSFIVSPKSAAVAGRHVHVLFKGPGATNPADLADSLESAVYATPYPDLILLMVWESEIADTQELLRRNPLLKQARQRASTKVSIAVAGYGNNGELTRVLQLDNAKSWVKEFVKGDADTIRSAGLNELFSSAGVVVVAPPGFVFVKPSGSRSRLFIRAEEALYESERVDFLAFALLKVVARRRKATGSQLDTIYVDSMAIANVAYALRHLLRDLYPMSPVPRVISFHSYEGLQDIEAPLPGTSLCIISASSSMALQGEWRRRTQCHESEVVTLLTLESAENAAAALFRIPPEREHQQESINREETLQDLRIVGERFAPEHIRPKTVLLRKREHATEESQSFFKAVRELAMVRILSSGHDGRPRTIFVDGAELVASKDFEDFAIRVLDQRTSISLQAIVYQDDPASCLLAWACMDYLWSNGHEVPVLSGAEIAQRSFQLDRHRALLIVAAVVGKGSRLLAISRDLRDVHEGGRCYLVGMQVCPLGLHSQQLKSNLRTSATGAAWAVEVYRTIRTGNAIAPAFKSERDCLRSSISDATLAKANLVERLNALDSGCGLGASVFLPTGEQLDEQLVLRKDFAFWNEEYSPSASLVPLILATLGDILQNAREEKSLQARDKLVSDAFQQVILEPSNFARFNDGVIQAALLRTAYPSELDYSCDSGASEVMLSLLRGVFGNIGKPQGEAALEFGLALATRRLKLCPQHHAALVEEIRAQHAPNSTLLKVLRLILGVEKREPSESEVL